MWEVDVHPTGDTFSADTIQYTVRFRLEQKCSEKLVDIHNIESTGKNRMAFNEFGHMRTTQHRK